MISYTPEKNVLKGKSVSFLNKLYILPQIFFLNIYQYSFSRGIFMTLLTSAEVDFDWASYLPFWYQFYQGVGHIDNFRNLYILQSF